MEIFNFDFLFDLLEPVHFAILLIVYKTRINYKNIYEVFRKAVVDIGALKGVKNNVILYSYFDLLDAGLISNSGQFLIDFCELQDFINKHCPVYIKNMIRHK